MSHPICLFDYVQLYVATLDNTSSNDTCCKTIQHILKKQKAPEWDWRKISIHEYLIDYWYLNHGLDWLSQRCLGHVVSLVNPDVMKYIMKIAAVENATVIWEWNPTELKNCASNGTFDAIATLWTLVIKVCSV